MVPFSFCENFTSSCLFSLLLLRDCYSLTSLCCTSGSLKFFSLIIPFSVSIIPLYQSALLVPVICGGKNVFFKVTNVFFSSILWRLNGKSMRVMVCNNTSVIFTTALFFFQSVCVCTAVFALT